MLGSRLNPVGVVVAVQAAHSSIKVTMDLYTNVAAYAAVKLVEAIPRKALHPGLRSRAPPGLAAATADSPEADEEVPETTNPQLKRSSSWE
jgi:hypothetical protein